MKILIAYIISVLLCVGMFIFYYVIEEIKYKSYYEDSDRLSIVDKIGIFVSIFIPLINVIVFITSIYHLFSKTIPFIRHVNSKKNNFDYLKEIKEIIKNKELVDYIDSKISALRLLGFSLNCQYFHNKSYQNETCHQIEINFDRGKYNLVIDLSIYTIKVKKAYLFNKNFRLESTDLNEVFEYLFSKI